MSLMHIETKSGLAVGKTHPTSGRGKTGLGDSGSCGGDSHSATSEHRLYLTT